jgi:L-ascorbate metabolism protein UlaG (beta-lactamase superfamily)
MDLALIRPFLENCALLGDIAATRENEGFRLWWLGQSGFLLQWNRRHLLFDPYLSDSLTQRYAGTPTPHIRMTALPLDPTRLFFVDIVTCSHSHTDHLDPETIPPLVKANPGLRLVIPEAERETADKKLAFLRPATVGLNEGESAEIHGFRINGVASAHERVERDSRGRCRFLGLVVQCGPWAIYHSGDTVLHAGLVT